MKNISVEKKFKHFISIFQFIEHESRKKAYIPKQNEPTIANLIQIRSVVIGIGNTIPFVFVERVVLHYGRIDFKHCSRIYFKK